MFSSPKGDDGPNSSRTQSTKVVRGTFNEFAALLARSGVTEIRAGLALGALVAFASAELLLGQAPVDADREDVIATWVDMVMALASTPGAE